MKPSRIGMFCIMAVVPSMSCKSSNGNSADLTMSAAERRAQNEARRQAEYAELCDDRDVKLFDVDPNHSWNALYRILYIRTDKQKCMKGWDVVDPYLYPRTVEYLKSENIDGILASLDRFLKDDAALAAMDTLQKAMMQRDLLQVFHWSVIASSRATPENAQAKRLARALKPAILAVALPEAEIRMLPDTLSKSILSDKYEANNIDLSSFERPYLPSKLTDPDRSFLVYSVQDGPAAPVHLRDFNYGSAFYVHILLPGVAANTRSYLDRLATFPNRELKDSRGQLYRNPQTPQFNAGTQVALVRRAVLWSNEGKPVISPIVESVQGRFYKSVGISLQNVDNSQRAYLLHLSQKKLLAGASDVLVNQNYQMKDYVHFLTLADPFERGGTQEGALDQCVRCHSQQDLTGHKVSAGIHSLISYSHIIGENSKTASPVYKGFAAESQLILEKLRQQNSWKMLAENLE